MSDTLADLASWLPSEFLSGDMDDKTHFLNNHNPHLFPYDFASSSSTESESDDDDVTGFTRRFTRSVSLQERLKTPYPVERKRVFSGSPESTLNWNFTGATQVRSSPATPPFVQPEEDAWDRIYAAVGQVARMKMRMNNSNDDVFANRGFLGAPRPVGPTLSHHNYHANCAVRRNVNEEFFRQQFHQRVSGPGNYATGGRCAATGPPGGFRHTAWPPLSENQPRQQPANGYVVKPVLRGSGGGCGPPSAVVKKECAGTGVFLPRSYNNGPPEPKKQPACSPASHLPARVSQSFNKNMDPITAQHQQPNIHPGFTPHYQVPPSLPHHLKRDELAEMLLARRNAVMLAHHHHQQQRRTTTQVGVTEKQVGPPEVVLPQEWTY